MQSSPKQIAVRLLLAAAILVLLFAGVPSARAQTLTTLYSFTGNPDAAGPTTGVILDAQGNLYGTTYGGGAYNAGTVFKLTPSGTETVLYSFHAVPHPPSIILRGPWVIDGANPESGLVMDALGNLYGTTSLGGDYMRQGGGPATWGTLFEVTADGSEKVLYRFTGGADGGNPRGGVIFDAQGNLYGTTWDGGETAPPFSACWYNGGCGTVFELTASGTLKVLYSFT